MHFCCPKISHEHIDLFIILLGEGNSWSSILFSLLYSDYEQFIIINRAYILVKIITEMRYRENIVSHSKYQNETFFLDILYITFLLFYISSYYYLYIYISSYYYLYILYISILLFIYFIYFYIIIYIFIYFIYFYIIIYIFYILFYIFSHASSVHFFHIFEICNNLTYHRLLNSLFISLYLFYIFNNLTYLLVKF